MVSHKPKPKKKASPLMIECSTVFTISDSLQLKQFLHVATFMKLYITEKKENVQRSILFDHVYNIDDAWQFHLLLRKHNPSLSLSHTHTYTENSHIYEIWISIEPLCVKLPVNWSIRQRNERRQCKSKSLKGQMCQKLIFFLLIYQIFKLNQLDSGK